VQISKLFPFFLLRALLRDKGASAQGNYGIRKTDAAKGVKDIILAEGCYEYP
jgi:hypothetical protein